MRTRIVPALIVPALIASATSALARTVETEVALVAKDGSRQTQRFVLEVGDTDCSSLALTGPQVQRVEACLVKNAVAVSAVFERVELKGRVAGVAGQRVILGSLRRPDGSGYEVVVSVR